MYDYGLSVLEQYGVEARASWRGRGALLCQTEKGLLIIREFQGSAKKLERQKELLDHLQETSGLKVDVILSNLEGEAVSQDKDGISYIVRRWYEGKECDARSLEDILKSVSVLGVLHNHMFFPEGEKRFFRSLTDEYIRHNRELRKIQRYIRNRKGKNAFETAYLQSVEWFLEKGWAAVEQLQSSSYEQLRQQAWDAGEVCHGDYNQHNVLLQGTAAAVTNFDKWNYDLQTADLYQFMRKVLEKHNWDKKLAAKMVEVYTREHPLSDQQLEHLRIRFSYPEKYWKLANHYYTHNKAWISGKDIEKIQVLIRQKNAWQDIGKSI